MTITDAFRDLMFTNAEWYKLAGLAKADADKFQVSFLKNGEGEAKVKQILGKAGYFATESWSKNKPDRLFSEGKTKEPLIDPQNKVIIPPGASESEIELIRQANSPLGNPHAK
jgi:hypothetical protein